VDTRYLCKWRSGGLVTWHDTTDINVIQCWDTILHGRRRRVWYLIKPIIVSGRTTAFSILRL
jgi:hypothetical protein